MTDYSILGLSTWALFSCMRMALWANVSWYMDNALANDTLLCKKTKEAIRLANCQPATEKEFAMFCWTRANGPDRIDCENMSPNEKLGLRKRMKGCPS